MVSIKDIAIECGVSIATVSKALNGHKDVSEITRQRVEKAAKEMGYFPNSQARALKTNRTYNLGVLFSERSDSGLTQSYFASVLNSFKKQAEQEGYDITFISGNIGERKMTPYEHCMYRNVDGVVVVCVDECADEGTMELLKGDVPVVTIDYKAEGRLSVISDNEQGMRQLVEYIVSRGHTKIAYIYGESSDVTAIRVKTFKETLSRLNINISSEHLLQGRYHDTGCTEVLFKEVLSCSNRPTCVILPDDFAAIGAINALEELGMSVPEDISIAGYDGIVLSQVLMPKLTTVRQDTERLGAEAAKRLIGLINKEISPEEEPIVIPGRLLEGASVKNLGR
ncbi:MAG: LacI family transcriptional regulator [Ruminococcus sp.]|nr:LacI family transcriptional regulator [Ruminococcus sp.]